jgi:hypothetical protein
VGLMSHDAMLARWDALTREDIAKMSKDACVYWLEWNDHNGCYSDADAIAEGFDPLTEESARELLLSIRFAP